MIRIQLIDLYFDDLKKFMERRIFNLSIYFSFDIVLLRNIMMIDDKIKNFAFGMIYKGL